MAQKTLIQLVDDLDGSPIADGEGKTVTLVFDNATYEIDLSNTHLGELTDALAPYLSAARKTTSGRAGGRSTSSKSDPAELQRIREWAARHGHNVSSRGRISAAVRDAYNAAQ